ncbi:MAG: DNA helicase [Clostridia bacterium]|nr:DNA helicase [Clostridia bacterium]
MNKANENGVEYQVENDGGLIHSPEFEETTIATLLTSYQSIVDTLDILSEDCFHNSVYREIYLAIMQVYNHGDSPDMLLVSDQLEKNGSTISRSEIIKLAVESMKVFDLRSHALILRDIAYRRKLWIIGYELMNKAADKTEPVISIHSSAKEKIDSLFEDSNSDVITLKDSYKQLQERMLLNRDLADGETYGTPTGFPELDRNGGLCGTDLIVIGAESSKGKTSFATALSISAIEHGDGVGFYSMEMDPVQLTARIASMKTGISASDILFNRLSIDQIYHIDSVMESFDTGKMYFDDRSTLSLDSILNSIRQLKFKYGIKGAVVDYLQLLNAKQSGLNIEQLRAECARRLKNLAKELGIWIIAISQLNRNDFGDIPTMARLRDSGQIAEAADNVLLLHRTNKSYPAPFDGVPTEGTSMVIIGKGRNIGTGEFICGFKPENTLFFPIPPEEMKSMKGGLLLPDDNQFKPLNDDPF